MWTIYERISTYWDIETAELESLNIDPAKDSGEMTLNELYSIAFMLEVTREELIKVL